MPAAEAFVREFMLDTWEAVHRITLVNEGTPKFSFDTPLCANPMVARISGSAEEFVYVLGHRYVAS